MKDFVYYLQSVFLQVRENWKKSGNFCVHWKVGEKYYFWTVRSRKLQISDFLCLQILKVAKFAASIKRPKSTSVLASRGGLCPLALRPGLVVCILLHYD